jgi:hypothetical protein
MDAINICLVLGLIVHFSLILAYQKIRNRKVYLSLLSISTFIALIGFLLRNQPYLKSGEINASVFFYLPILSLLYLGFFRLFFQEMFGEEPLMTKAYSLSWEQGEYRRLHFGDLLFTLFTILGPIFTIMLVNNLLYA